MEQLLIELKDLSKETAGSYFVLYYSSKIEEWTINLTLRKVKITHSDMKICIQNTVDYIKKNRVKREDDSYVLK